MIANNQEKHIQSIVQEAFARGYALKIVGGNSKSFYGRSIQAEPLRMDQHQGIINYHPSELVITARSGTSLSTLENLLAEQGQMLAFEPPRFSESATLGGTIACGFSGARRPFAGAARDFVLGCKILTGCGEILSFGGEVMKNVAGYDVSRLMVGALGTLGVILEVSLKVLPLPEYQLTLVKELGSSEAIKEMSGISSVCQPISGLGFHNNLLYLRFSGTEKAIEAAAKKHGGERATSGNEFWLALREQQLEFFQSKQNLWRISVLPASPELKLEGEWFYDWGGALRWLKSDTPAENIFFAAQDTEGYATLFRGVDRSETVFQPLLKKNLQIQKNLKHQFDPGRILNPQKLYRGL